VVAVGAALVTVLLRYGQDVLSARRLIGLSVGLLCLAYIEFLGFRLWVYLYSDRLEIRTALSKLVEDRLGMTLGKPVVIYYGQIKALRRTRGFGGFNALGVLLRERKPWQRPGYGIPYQGVENYADLEAELLRRVPPNCELYSVNFLGHRGPFK
jgi:hypothetical protein